MGHDHVADGQGGGGADGGAQAGAIGEAAARIDDGDTAVAHDEADIGDAVEIGGGGLGAGADPHVITRRGLYHGERLYRTLSSGRA
jgi:hypothetical protein